MKETIHSTLQLIRLAEKLKFELRHSWLSNGRRESVAEHTWQMALMAILIHKYLSQPVDLEKTLKMILIHDLIEAEVGDIPFFEKSPRKDAKQKMEQQAIENIKNQLNSETGDEIYNLWYEFEAYNTPEAKFAKALDNLEVQIQHNLAQFETWEEIEYDLVYNKMDQYCEYDPFLKELCQEIKAEAEDKMIKGGIDVQSVKAKATRQNS